ncbi:hypothetical protein VU09_33450 [Burkholderia pseudomallei]|nr:hypothetical protein VU09_33450 [Burkholderia pseudomallei]
MAASAVAATAALQREAKERSRGARRSRERRAGGMRRGGRARHRGALRAQSGGFAPHAGGRPAGVPRDDAGTRTRARPSAPSRAARASAYAVSPAGAAGIRKRSR